MRLDGKAALITGAGSGIGRASTHAFAREGASVLAVDVDDAAALRTVDEAISNGGVASAFPADVREDRECRAMVAAAESRFGKLDVLFNNAGISHPDDADAVTTTRAVWDETFDVNVKGVFFGCKHGIPALQRAGGGSIINNASFVALPGAATPQLAYTASKGAVWQ